MSVLPSKEPSSTRRYLPQLDGLRAVAVLTVLVQHWGGSHITISGLPIGGLGVGLFFVLSGYLITGILLRNRGATHAENRRVLRQFWIRRILRIFPVFYLAILLGIVFRIPNVREHCFWHLGYISNILIWKLNDLKGLGYATHFWTLAIEEQFYLVWPLLVLFVPRGQLKPVVIMGIAVAPAWRFWSVHLPNADSTWAALPAQLDYLCLGSLLATTEARLRGAPNLAFWSMLVVGLTGFVVCHFGLAAGAFKQFFVALIFTWLIFAAANRKLSRLGDVLENRVMTTLGRVSYGIYVFHMFAPFFWAWLYYSAPIPGYRVLQRLQISAGVHQHPLFVLLMYSLITGGLVMTSFVLVERPLLRRKERFPYQLKNKSNS